MPNGLEFLHSLLVLAASATVGRRLSDFPGASWLRNLGCLTGWLASGLYALNRAGLVEADMRVFFGGIIFSLLFVCLP